MSQQPPCAPVTPLQPAAAAVAAAAASPPCFAALLSFSDSAFVVLSPSGGVLYVSPSAHTVFDAPAEALLGNHILDWVHPEECNHLAAMIRAVREAAPNSAPAVAHLRVLRKPPHDAEPWLWAEMKLSSDGEYLYLVARDVTSEKVVEESLRVFLLTTSHDLRTPCHGMKCASQLLAARAGVAADPEAMYLLGVVRASCRLLLLTIQNVLSLKTLEAQAAAGHVRPLRVRERIDVRALLVDVLEICRVGCSKEGAWLNQADASIIPVELEGDFGRVRQVLQNAAVVCAGYAAAAHPFTVQVMREPPPPPPNDGAPGGVHLRIRFSAGGRVLTPAEAGEAFEPYNSCAGLALLVARSLTRSMDGDVCLLCDARGVHIDVRLRLFAPDAPPLSDSDEDTPRAAAARLALPPRAGPPTPAVELTGRMLKHLMTWSDDLFSTGEVVGRSCIVDFASESMNEHWYGYKAENLRGLDAAALCHPDDSEHYLAAVHDAMARSAACGGGMAPLAVTRRIKKPDGSWIPVHTSGSIEGSRWSLVCKLLRKQEEKERSMRSLLLAISHELRTPAQSGLASSQLLAQRASVTEDTEAAFLVQAIGASCGLLLGLVSNALSMRSIESGTLDMRPTAFDPRDAIRDLLQVCRMGCCTQAGVAWVNEAEPLPRVVEADRSFLFQIVQNLVTNAIKFDDGRGVAVSLRCETASPPARRPPRVSSCGTLAAALSLDSPRVSACSPAGEHNTCGAAQLPPTHTLVATVADRGPGIAPQDCERIFRPYEAASQASGGGAGLGLHIARACARRAGGDVCVESELGNGATFTLRFPVRVPADAAAEWEAVALHSWQQQPAQPPPVAPLTPSSSALDMCAMGVPKRGRVLPEAGSTLPCAVAAPASPPSSPAALLPLRCLLADDHPTNLLLVKRLLERQGGFVVTTAVNGKEAFERLVAAFEAGAPPHIAVIDMQMPVMSGPAGAAAFRAWEAAHRAGCPALPLYCLTANVLDEAREECEEAGFDAVITKPLRKDALMELLARAQAYAGLAAAPAC